MEDDSKKNKFCAPLTEEEKAILLKEQESILKLKYGNHALMRQKSKSNVQRQYFDSADYSMAQARNVNMPKFPPAHLAKQTSSEKLVEIDIAQNIEARESDMDVDK
ncbi:hypothetical protein A3Q56_07251 [Intoshia linei]|uniref:Uncharacterized protein n=1 Tax=Intoshia linei TaxID=1819745 RepID=A0A177ASR8_9BILA|nr:hypothetical protein A3Q56_07251 [Intoshia linei]